jgi:hypothetical protein
MQVQLKKLVENCGLPKLLSHCILFICLTTLPTAENVQLQMRGITEQVGKDVEGIGRGKFQTLSLSFPGETEENHEDSRP